MTESLHFNLADADATVAIGALLARHCHQAMTFYLYGDLGAGKTTLTRGFIQSLGHQGNVKSPTYALVEAYEPGDWQICHFDLYRLADPEELEFMGFRDYFTDRSLCLIEWPQKGEGMLPPADIELDLSYQGEARMIEVKACSDAGRELLKQLQ